MAPTRRIGKWTLIFKWWVMILVAVATVIVMWQLSSDRRLSQIVRIPGHFLPVANSAIPQTVSNVTVWSSVLALAFVALAQILVIGLTELGRHRAVVPITVEVMF